MKLKFLSKTAMDKLRNSIGDNLDAYRSGEAPKLLEALPEGSICESRLEAGEIPELVIGEGRPEDDAENARRINRWLSSLTPLEASDQRLWAWLCHGPFADYVAQRWQFGSGADPQNHVAARYFLKSTSLESFSRNGLTRLWWAAHQTKDDRREDPFELTPVLFGHQTLQQALMERAIGRSKPVVQAVLRAWQKWIADKPRPARTDDVIKYWLKSLRLTGAVTLLDACDEERLWNLAYVRLSMAVDRFSGAH